MMSLEVAFWMTLFIISLYILYRDIYYFVT